MQKPHFVRADWDEEAQVRVAEGDEVPGLATEAATVEALIPELKHMIPELLELNGVPGEGEIAFEPFTRRFDRAQRAAA